MATITITKGGTLPDSANKEDFYTMVDSATATITDIVNADINASAAIVDTKLDTISTAGKVSLTALGNVTAAPAADHTASGLKITLTAHENMAFGDVCYINSDGEAALAKGDAIATSKVVCMCADATISADASGNFLLYGIARHDAWAWTPGAYVFLSATGTTTNTTTATAPTTEDSCTVILGIATHADRMLFNPQLVIVEHTA